MPLCIQTVVLVYSSLLFRCFCLRVYCFLEGWVLLTNRPSKKPCSRCDSRVAPTYIFIVSRFIVRSCLMQSNFICTFQIKSVFILNLRNHFKYLCVNSRFICLQHDFFNAICHSATPNKYSKLILNYQMHVTICDKTNISLSI